MIESFLDSWSLFQESYLLGLALSALLPLIGVMVVLRRQLFVAAAISQSSVFGMAFGLWMQHLAHVHGPHGGVADWVVILPFSLLSSLLCIRTSKQAADQREVTTALVFILSTTFAFVLLSQCPIGLKEVQERMSSSLISSSMHEFYICIALIVFLCIFWWKYHRPIILISTDPDTAKVMGWRVMNWEFVIATIVGLVLGWAVYLSGWLLAFGCLIIPVFIGRLFAKSIYHVLWLAPCFGVVISFAAYIIAHAIDAPFSQMAVALMGVVYIFSMIFKSRRFA